MGKKMAKSYSDGSISSIIGSDARLEGTFVLEGAMRIDGKFVGTLVCGSSVTIGPNSELCGDVEAEEVILGGRLKGTLAAKNRLVLEGTASLEGEIATCSLVVEEGAKFSGQSSMGKDAVDALIRKMKKVLPKPIDQNETKSKGVYLFENEIPSSSQKSSQKASQVG